MKPLSPTYQPMKSFFMINAFNKPGARVMMLVRFWRIRDSK